MASSRRLNRNWSSPVEILRRRNKNIRTKIAVPLVKFLMLKVLKENYKNKIWFGSRVKQIYNHKILKIRNIIFNFEWYSLRNGKKLKRLKGGKLEVNTLLNWIGERVREIKWWGHKNEKSGKIRYSARNKTKIILWIL